MKIFEAVAKAVAAEGTEVVFSVMDEVTISLVQAMHEEGVRVIHARHEQGAVVMADGYARATGKPGVCTVGTGPGLAQTGTGLVTARKRGSPLLVIAGDMPAGDRGNAKTFDQRRYVESTAGHFVPLRRAMTVGEDVQLAFRTIRAGRGPVVFNAPVDVLRSDYPWEWQYQASRATMPPPFRLAPDPVAVERAAAMLVAAKRPVILAGRGAVLSEARGEIEALASRTGALLGTSLQAWQYFRGHPSYIGVFGAFAADSAVELLAQADLILAVGASLNPYTTGGGRIAPKAKVVHIDQDQDRFGEFTPVELGIQGDARTVVAAINASLAEAGISERPSFWASESAQALIKACRPRPPAAAIGSEQLRLAQVLAELDRVLPQDRVVVVDGGMNLLFVWDHITVPGPDSLVWPKDFQSIGLGLAMGIGAALGRPDRHCIVFAGDGGFMMNIQELETAARYHIPLTIVVLNDGAYGAEVYMLKEEKKPPALACFQDVDFADVARAFKARGLTVRTLADIQAVGKLAGKRDGPVVVDAKIATEEEHRVFKSAARA
ncbi:MAG: thiamine pyrophosphate-binding protein [Chloroflexi bacterium]|nr:thiamine pyrophosphate-binding protein [Chloroflexota bacterium]